MARSITQPSGLIAIIITLLALADGILHLSLDYVLFQGNLVGRLGPPPGAAPPPGGGGGPPSFPLPLNQMFVLNLLGYVAMLLLFWLVAPRLGSWSWLINALFIVYVAVVFYAWVRFGAPNPRGYLGYLSKSVEIVLVLALIADLWMGIRSTSSERFGRPTLANTA